MNDYLNNEEQDFFESLHENEWVISPDKNEIDKYINYARNNIEAMNKFEVELSDRDFFKFKAKALEQGINYKSLVSMLIHQYNNGRIALNI
jgi:predicted DNA binding CopG/RHH family protein